MTIRDNLKKQYSTTTIALTTSTARTTTSKSMTSLVSSQGSFTIKISLLQPNYNNKTTNINNINSIAIPTPTKIASISTASSTSTRGLPRWPPARA